MVRSHPAWTMTALLAGYPVWWVLGLGDLSVIILAVPMLVRMRAWRRQGRPIRVPPSFGLWLMFLVVVAAGLATLGLTAPGTVVSPLSNRLLSFADRGLTYVGLTVILLFAGNLTEAELPRSAGWPGCSAWSASTPPWAAWPAWSLPSTSSSSPRWPTCCRTACSRTALVQAALLPWLLPGHRRPRDNRAGRPKAPFEYTNTWGNVLDHPAALAVRGLVVLRQQARSAPAGQLVTAVVRALIPLVYSLNRGVWVGRRA